MGEELGDFGFGSRRPLARNGPIAVQSGMTGKHEEKDGDDAEDGNGESDSESESVEEGKGHEKEDKDLDPPASGSEEDQSHARTMRTQSLDDHGARRTAQGRGIMKDSMLGGNKISIGCLYMVREFPPKILSFIIPSG